MTDFIIEVHAVVIYLRLVFLFPAVLKAQVFATNQATNQQTRVASKDTRYRTTNYKYATNESTVRKRRRTF